MQIRLMYISPRRDLKAAGARMLVDEYLRRCQRFGPVTLECVRQEQAVAELLVRRSGRMPPFVVLLDSLGSTLTSPQLADTVKRQRDAGTAEIAFAVGPPDGWSAALRGTAPLLLSFGAITLPHELALVVLAEQVYRALTILAGHPYHAGHE